jgi:hypothetical protein
MVSEWLEDYQKHDGEHELNGRAVKAAIEHLPVVLQAASMRLTELARWRFRVRGA